MKEAGEELREIEQFEKLVYKVANKYKSKKLDNDDIIQEGFIGLIKGIRTYQQGRASKVTHYYNYIRYQILNALRDASDKGREETKRDISLDINIKEDMPLLELLGNSKARDPEDIIINKMLIEELEEQFNTILTEQESKVIKALIDGGNLQDLSRILNIDYKTITRIKRSATTKLKSKSLYIALLDNKRELARARKRRRKSKTLIKELETNVNILEKRLYF